MKNKLVWLVIILLIITLYIFFTNFFSPSYLLNGFNPKKYGPDCEYVGQCGNLISVNCRAEVDGPFYYVNKKTGEILEYCGGYCMTDDPTGKYCQNCPPKEWNCKITPSIPGNTVILKLPDQNGNILEYEETIQPGDNAFSLLTRVSDRENIDIEYRKVDSFTHVYKIGDVGGLIMDCGLVLLVNNNEVLPSPDKISLTPGDEIQWVFRCEDK